MSLSEEHIFKQGNREFHSKDIHLIQQTFKMFPKLSQSDLIETVCEHLDWLTASGLPKRHACKQLLFQMEEQDLIQLPKKRCPGAISQPPPIKTSQTDAPEPCGSCVPFERRVRHSFLPGLRSMSPRC